MTPDEHADQHADEYDLTLPALGESVTEATILRWLIDEGTPVNAATV